MSKVNTINMYIFLFYAKFSVIYNYCNTAKYSQKLKYIYIFSI